MAKFGLLSWQRNLAIIWLAELLSIAGFSVVLPFLPYYVQELGIQGTNEVAFWSGLLTSSQAITMALIAPVWGSLADRYGRKIMVERSMYGGAIVMSLMGLVSNVYQLAILRAIQGLLTGTVAAATTLVASGTPPERRGFSLGLLQMAIYSGSSLGPFLGGFVADQFGYRSAFWITGALLLLSGILTTLLVREEFVPVDKKAAGEEKGSMWRDLAAVFSTQALVVIFGIRVLVRMSSQIVGPVLPLFIQSITGEGAKVASVTGTISGLASATSAVGAVVLGRASDRIGARRVLLVCSVVACVLYVLQSQVGTSMQLLVLRTFEGIAVGGIVASASALQASLVPKARFGAVYGVDTSLVAAANAVAPMAGAAMTTIWGLSSVFLGAAVMYALSFVVVAVMVPAQKHAAELPRPEAIGPESPLPVQECAVEQPNCSKT